MSTVLIDVEVLRRAPCGLAEVAGQLGRRLVRQRPRDLRLLFFAKRRHLGEIQPHATDVIEPRRCLKARFVRPLQPLVSCLARKPDYQLWHATNQFCRYLPLRNDVPVVLTIHDLNFLHSDAPAEHVARELRRLQQHVNRASVVTTISRYVADEIRGSLDLADRPLRVIHNGGPTRDETQPQPPPIPLASPFLFSIGQFRQTKNFHVLLDLLHRLPAYQLVIAGDCGTKYGEMLRARIAREGLGSRVLLPGLINNAQRKWLYENCEAFVFPSQAEGFGLPVLEAMQLGRPVFLSRATSLPEVGGDLAFYWDAWHPDAMRRVFADGMARYRSDVRYASRLQQHARTFSWSAAARSYLELYQEVLQQRPLAVGRRAA